MKPSVTLLTNESVNQIIEEGFALLEDPGIELHNQEAVELLLSAGAKADQNSHVVRIPERVARKALKSCPKTFSLYYLSGDPIVNYGGKEVHFDPGSAALTILDRESQRARDADTADFVYFINASPIGCPEHGNCVFGCAGGNWGFISPLSGSVLYVQTDRYRRFQNRHLGYYERSPGHSIRWIGKSSKETLGSI